MYVFLLQKYKTQNPFILLNEVLYCVNDGDSVRNNFKNQT